MSGDAMVYLARAIAELLVPLNVIFILLIITFTLLLFNRKRLSLGVLSLALMVFIVAGYGIGVRGQIESKEYQFHPLTEDGLYKVTKEHPKYVVVLGSGHVSDPRLTTTSQIGGASLYRLVEGIKIQRKIQNSKLVILGGAVYDPVPNAYVVSDVARQIGVSVEDLIIEDSPMDTIQEAALVKPLVGEESFILVTSALHMPRALEIFTNSGMQPIPAPTDYIIKGKSPSGPGRLLPSTANLELSKRVIYEWAGALWAQFNGV